MGNKSTSFDLKINIGSGPIGKDDWVNLDYGILAFIGKFKSVLSPLTIFAPEYKELLKAWPKTRIHDCRKRFPFGDNEVSHAFTSHFLEHLKKYEAEFVVGEVFRIMKPGGYFRIIVPDLEIMAQKYLARDHDFFSSIDMGIEKNSATSTDLFLSLIYPTCHLKKTSGLVKQFIDRFARWHMWMYDFDSLKKILAQAGFEEIEKKSFGESKIPDISGLEIYPDSSLFVEGRKP